MKKYILLLVLIISSVTGISAKKTVVAPSYAWSMLQPLGLHEPTSIDTLFLNYGQRSVPSAVSPAYATTGNLGTEGLNMIFFDRQPAQDFFFADALSHWTPSEETMKFYNTRIPMTLLSYNFGGGKETAQDRLKADFSGNINKNAQIGALADYLYSKGSYNNQAAKGLTWGFSGSYIGERFEFQGFYNHYNIINKENGGITDDRYITDPAEVQGGSTSVDTKTIPTNLSNAHNRLVGGQLYLNSRYKVGHYREIEQGDSAIEEFVPVTSFIWTLNYKDHRHTFRNTNSTEDEEFWEHSYLTYGETNDKTSMWSIRNTFGISLLEGFHKYAKAGLALYLTHEYKKLTQTTDTLDRSATLPEGLTPLPDGISIPHSTGDNRLWVGAQLTRQQGRIINYDATAEIGVVGDAAGEIKINGNIYTNIPLFGDTVSVKAYGTFENVSPPLLYQQYLSNHYVWSNDFGKTRRFRIGGELTCPQTRTHINIGVENLQNYIYFNSEALPTQHSSSVQVFNATLHQNFKVGILNWQNSITYQTSTDETVIPLPKLAIYSNLFIQFKVAHVLDVQFGVDCDYYTKYKAVAYQPATMSFYNQQEIDCGNYPFMNAYINMKLGKTRFYVMFSHVNQGMTGSDYFSLPHYPLNPRRFQLGLSIDFAN